MKTKIATIVIALLMSTVSFSVFLTGVSVGQPDIAEPMFAGGDGSIGSPYQISNVTHLQWMGNVSNLNKNFTLINDIDASATLVWNAGAGFVPIGNSTAKFNGSLDGLGYNITGLFINRPAENYVGLFGYLNFGTSLNNICLVGNNITGLGVVGAFAALSSGTVTNCSATGNVSGINDMIGGLMAYNCQGTVANCYATVNVSGFDYVGGLMGYHYQGTVANCYATSNVSGTNCVGGLVGYNRDSTLTNCYATGNATGTNNYVGGLVGHNTDGAWVTNCYATGNVNTTTAYVGGLVGYNDVSQVRNCYATGNVSGPSGASGGLVGYNSNAVILNCYSIGNATGNVANTGGLVGWNGGGSILESFWDNQTSGLDISAGGTGLNTSDMMDLLIFSGAGWDFENIWAIRHTYSYPFFHFENWNTNPIAYNDSYTFSEDGILEIPASGVLANDEDIDEFIFPDMGGYDLSVTAYDNPSTQGAVVNINADGSFTYNPTGTTTFQNLSVGEYLIDTFTYTVSDDKGGIDTAIVTINVTGVNDGPDANNDFEIVDEDTILNIVVPGLLTNDIDTDANDTLSVVANTFMTINGAVVTINADGSYNYDPTGSAILQALAVGEYIIDTFIYTVIDGNGGTDTGMVSINVTGVNDAPTITTSDIVEVIAGQVYFVDYDATEIDASDILVWSQNSDASWFVINTTTGMINATPANADAGTHWVNVSVDDGNGGTDSTNFSLEVLLDTDGDGDPDTTDPDDDNDGTPDTSDDFPLDPTEDTDTDLDGTGDNADTDDDDDGTPDTSDDFPLDPAEDTDTDLDGTGDNADTDDDGDGTPDTSDDFPFDPSEDTDTDNDTIGNNADIDDDGDGWLDTIEIVGGFDPLDNTSMPSDADSDGIADFMDPDFLTVTEYNNQTVWDNVTIWNNATADLDADSDSDGWNDIVEILAGTDPEDSTSTPLDADGDGIADFMDPDNAGDPGTVTVTETPAWAWGAIIAAVVMGILAAIGFMREGSGGGKPEGVEEVSEPEAETEVSEELDTSE